MRSFQHITPPLRLFYGPESLKSIGNELARLQSKRAVIVCGSSLSRKGSLLDLVQSSIAERCAGAFVGVRAHSPLPSVEAAAQELKRLEADAIIALGGGSAIVTARAASILIAESGDLQNLSSSLDKNGNLRSPKLLAPKLPQFVIPTTPTTAIAKAGSAVFDPVLKKRFALFDPKTRAHSVFIYPEASRFTPDALFVNASLNTFAMAIEGLISRSGDPVSDALLMHSIRLIAAHLPSRACAEDPTARSELILAGILCGQGTDHAGAGITTVIGHAIGALYDLDNGLSNAIVLPHALRFNADSAKAGFSNVAASLRLLDSLSKPLVTSIIATVEAMIKDLGIPTRLREVGVPREALAEIASNARDDWFLRGNPRPVDNKSDILQILEEAW